MDRLVVSQGAVSFGVGKEGPAFGSSPYQDDQRVRVAPVVIDIGRRGIAQGPLEEYTGKPWRGGHASHPAHAEEPSTTHDDGVGAGDQGRKRNLPFTREIAQIDQLGLTG